MSNYYRLRFDSEWVDVTNGRINSCCDCGLCHKEEYQLIKGENGDLRILRRVFRQNRDTAARRRGMIMKKEGLWKRNK